MGDEPGKILDPAEDQLQRHVGMAGFAHPYPLEAEILPSDVRETIDLHLPVGLPEAGGHTRSSVPHGKDAFLQGPGLPGHLKGRVHSSPPGRLQNDFPPLFRREAMAVQQKGRPEGLAHFQPFFRTPDDDDLGGPEGTGEGHGKNAQWAHPLNQNRIP